MSASCDRDTVPVVQAVVSSFFAHAARRETKEGYRAAVDRQSVFVDRTSGPQGRSPEMVFHELVTSRENTREVVAVDPAWLLGRSSVFLRVGRRCSDGVETLN